MEKAQIEKRVDKKADKKARHRSPNYPAVSLKRAVELTQMIYEKDRTHPVPISIAATRWGLKAKGSQVLLYTAALKAYGLIDVAESGANREISVTDTARRVILNSEDKKEILQRAALTPKIHREIWDQYNGELPQDDILRNYLLFKRHFNENAVGGLITQLRETFVYADMSNIRIMVDDSDDSDQDVQQDETQEDTQLGLLVKSTDAKPKAVSLPNTTDSQLQLRFVVPSGEILILVPRTMTKGDYKILSAYLVAFESALPGHSEDRKPAEPIQGQ